MVEARNGKNSHDHCKDRGPKQTVFGLRRTQKWVIHGLHTLRDFRKANPVSGIIDSGNDGLSVCGERGFEAFHDCCVRNGLDVRWTNHTQDDRILYQFGAGTAHTYGHYDVDFKGWIGCLRIDIVPGWLPLLLGVDFLESRGIHIDFRTKTVLRFHDATKTIVKVRESDCTDNVYSLPMFAPKADDPIFMTTTSKTHYTDYTPDDVKNALGIRGSKRQLDPEHSPSVGIDGMNKTDRTRTEAGKQNTDKISLDVNAGNTGDEAQQDDVSDERRQEDDAEGIPKVLKLTLENVRKLHSHGHPPASRLREFLLRCVTRPERKKWWKQIRELTQKIEQACAECEGCKRQASDSERRAPRTLIREDTPFNHTIGIDMFCVDHGQNIWALTAHERSLGEAMIRRTSGRTAEAAGDCFYVNWTCRWGAPEEAVWSDVGSEFRGAFTQRLEQLGAAKFVRAAYEHESEIERMNLLFRRAVKRVKSGKNPPKNTREWDIVLATIENDARNTITTGKYSASIRSTGRSSLAYRTLIDDTPTSATADGDELRRTLELEDAAKEAYHYERNNRRLRRILYERTKPERREYKQGELVYYRRETTWHGPGIVLGYNENSKYYWVDVSGTLIRAGLRSIKPMNSMPTFGSLPVHDPIWEEEEERGEGRKEDTALTPAPVEPSALPLGESAPEPIGPPPETPAPRESTHLLDSEHSPSVPAPPGLGPPRRPIASLPEATALSPDKPSSLSPPPRRSKRLEEKAKVEYREPRAPRKAGRADARTEEAEESRC